MRPRSSIQQGEKTVLALFRVQEGLYGTLLEIGRRQLECLKAGSPIEEFLAQYERRMECLRKLTRVDGEIRKAFKNNDIWPAEGTDGHAELASVLANIARALTEVLVQEQECRALLEVRIEKIKAELARGGLERDFRKLMSAVRHTDARFVEVST